jgi:unsaturated rhamnogalacturonyl hydrolase
MKTISMFLLLFLAFPAVVSQQPSQTDSNTPLHLLKPNYPVPYGIAKSEEIAAVLRRVHGYLDEVTPTAFVNSRTRDVLSDLARIDENTTLQPGDFRIVSYEWGVT